MSYITAVTPAEPAWKLTIRLSFHINNNTIRADGAIIFNDKRNILPDLPSQPKNALNMSLHTLKLTLVSPSSVEPKV